MPKAIIMDPADKVATALAAVGHVIAAKMPIPSIGYFAYCADTDRNPLGIIENDPSAK